MNATLKVHSVNDSVKVFFNETIVIGSVGVWWVCNFVLGKACIFRCLGFWLSYGLFGWKGNLCLG